MSEEKNIDFEVEMDKAKRGAMIRFGLAAGFALMLYAWWVISDMGLAWNIFKTVLLSSLVVLNAYSGLLFVRQYRKYRDEFQGVGTLSDGASDES